MSLKKKLIIIVSVVLLLAVGGVVAFLFFNKEEAPPPPPLEPITDKQVTIAELKEKYKYQDNKISPLYNVSPTEQFKITFNSYLGDIPASELITVHTHEGLGTDSTIDIELVPETYEVGPSTFTIKPKESVLTKTDGSWGMNHMYYIKVNYDLDSNTPTRLEQPIVIPFTIKGTAENVDLVGEVAPNGQFQLTWLPLTEGSTSIQVNNIIKSTNTKYESDKTPFEANGFISTFTRNIGGSSSGVFTDFLSKNLATGTAPSPTNPSSSLNRGVKGAYYLQNIDGDKHSVASNIINISEYANRIPLQLVSPLANSTHDTIRSLPKTVQVQMLDGSVTDQFVNYKIDGVTVTDGQPTTLSFTVANTSYNGTLVINKVKQSELEVLKQGELVNLVSSYQKPKNKTKTKPSITLPTLISQGNLEVTPEDKDKENAPTELEEDTNSEQGTKTPDGSLGLGDSATSEGVTEEKEAELGLINKQYLYNKEALETANEQTITIPAYIQEAQYEMVHASALEEYLAYSLLARDEVISLEAFPEAQVYSVVSDVVDKIITQNPLINNVTEWYYDYTTRSLNFTYDTSFSSSDLLSKALSITEELTMVDAVLTEQEIKEGVEPYKVKKEMTQQELYQAIIDYLTTNVALTSLMEGNETTKSSAYNSLLEGVADDLGTAKAFKLLMDISDIPTIVVTGYYQGKPHVWNKIALNEAWYNVDVTLNMDTLGIPNALSLSSDDTAKLLGYSEDKGYWTDQHITVFSATSGGLDYYGAKGLEVDTVEDYAKVLESQLLNGERVVVIRTRIELDPKLIFDTTGLVVQQTVPERLSSATFNAKGKYYIVITHEEEPVEDEQEEEEQEEQVENSNN